MTVLSLHSFAAGKWVAPSGRVAQLKSAVTGGDIAEIGSGGVDFGAMAEIRARDRRTGAEGTDLPRARGDAEGAGAISQRAPRAALRAFLRHRRDQARFHDRHRRRHRHAVRLRLQGPARDARRHGLCRRQPRAARRAAAISSASTWRPRCKGVAVHINAFNFPVWGMLEKLSTSPARRRAGHRQAGLGDRLADGSLLPHDDRSRKSSRRARSSSWPAAPATCSTGWIVRTWSPSPARHRRR